MTMLDNFKEKYKDDLWFQRACKKANYELQNGYVVDIFICEEDVTALYPYPNNRLKANHKPMRRMRHYARRQNYDR